MKRIVINRNSRHIKKNDHNKKIKLLLSTGKDIENISAHLGHASSDITPRVYAHMYAEVKVRMAKTISSALFST